jgi:ABC-type uncharacterized transport system
MSGAREGARLAMKDVLQSYFWRGEVLLIMAALAVFLIMTWVLRGAAPGQKVADEDDLDAPRAGVRERNIAAVVAGLMLILVAACVLVAYGIPWSLPIFAFGFGIVLFQVARNRRHRHGSPSLRRAIDLSTALVNTGLLAGVLIVLNVILFRYCGRPIDMTREGTYTVSSLTVNQLSTLDRPVTFTMVFGRGVRATRQLERVSQLLGACKSVNPQMVTLTSLDPYSDTTGLEELAKHVPELSLLQGGGIVIQYGREDAAQYVVVRNQDLFQPIPLDPARGGLDHYASAFSGEDEVTSALVRMREGKRSKVAFTTAHGELLTSDLDPRGRGAGIWKSRLNKVGCDVFDVNLADELPTDLSLLVIAGPKSPFRPDELTRLQSYADRGGPVLILVGNDAHSGLDEFLKSYNVSIGQGVVIDPRRNFNNDARLVYAPTQAGVRHPIVDPIGPNRAVLLARAAPLHVAGQGQSAGDQKAAPINPAMVPVAILLTSGYSWAETDLAASPLRRDKNDEPGPLTVGVAVSERAQGSSPTDAVAGGKPRLVVFSCAAMAENAVQEVEQTNLDMLMNAASWLRGRPDTQGVVAPNPHVALTLSVDPYMRSRLILVPSVVMFLSIIAMAIIVYTARRE